MRRSTRLSAMLVLLVALVAGDIPRVSGAQDASPTAADLPEIVIAFGEAWSSGDPEQLVAIYAEDVLFEEVVLDGTVTHGRDELRAYAEAVYAAFPDFTVTPMSGFVSGDRAVLEWVLTGTYEGQFGPLPPGSGQQVAVRVASVLELADDGLIRRDSEYWDFATVLTQLGAMPEVEAATTP
ncbi:MAG: ester cyclase [Thermomicrobiales bacterium]